MKRPFACAVLVCIAVTGCVGGPTTPTPTAESTRSPTLSDTPTPTSSDGSETSVSTLTTGESDGSATATTRPENVSVEYLVRVDSLPDHVANVTIEFGGVYFSEVPRDIDSCAGTTPPMDNQYDPTPTPLPTPAGACWGTDAPTVTLTPEDGTRSLGRYEAPGRFDGGDMLVVRDVVVRFDNETVAKRVYDTDFLVARREPTTETFGLAVSISYNPSVSEAGWVYSVDASAFDPSE